MSFIGRTNNPREKIGHQRCKAVSKDDVIIAQLLPNQVRIAIGQYSLALILKRHGHI